MAGPVCVSGAAAIEIAGITKRYQALRPLRIARLILEPGDRVALAGFDAAAAELFVNLVTGAAVPDEGDVRIAGRNTRDIATDTEWLASLDRFGIVTERAVLLEGLSIAANLALPLTLAIDPMPADTRARVDALATLVGLAPSRLAEKASTLSAEERVRAHLARALGPEPEVLLLEHPTARLSRHESQSIGSTLKAVSLAKRLGWVALTEDEEFARAAGGRRLRLEAKSGKLVEDGFWRRIGW
jgi:predicted ABC-type transport system involved in lysophospholipase L1 biosynthesis ATPase subunit